MSLSTIVTGNTSPDTVKAGFDKCNLAIAAINALGAPSAAGLALLQAADAVAQAALIGSNGGVGAPDTGLVPLYGPDGNLLSTYASAVRSQNYSAIVGASSDGWSELRCAVSPGAVIEADYYTSGALATGTLKFPGSLSGSVIWSLPEQSGTLMLTSAIGSTVQAFSSALDTLAGKTLTGSDNLVCATSPTLTTPILGTPTSGTLTNCTGLPLSTGTTGTLAVARGGTGITSFGSGVATWLGSPTVANLNTALGVTLATTSSTVTIGSTSIAVGGTSTSLAGITGFSLNGGVMEWSANSAATPTRGLGSLSTSDLSVYLGGARNFAFSSTSLYFLGSSPTLILNSNTAPQILFGGSSDLILTRAAAASLQLGTNHATTPTKQTIKSHNVTTGTGSTLCLAGGTGSVAGGAIELATSATTGAPVARMTIKANGNINVTLPTSSAGLASGDLWNNGGVVTVA